MLNVFRLFGTYNCRDFGEAGPRSRQIGNRIRADNFSTSHLSESKSCRLMCQGPTCKIQTSWLWNISKTGLSSCSPRIFVAFVVHSPCLFDTFVVHSPCRDLRNILYWLVFLMMTRWKRSRVFYFRSEKFYLLNLRLSLNLAFF